MVIRHSRFTLCCTCKSGQLRHEEARPLVANIHKTIYSTKEVLLNAGNALWIELAERLT